MFAEDINKTFKNSSGAMVRVLVKETIINLNQYLNNEKRKTICDN